jgi:hypothetical protein
MQMGVNELRSRLIKLFQSILLDGFRPKPKDEALVISDNNSSQETSPYSIKKNGDALNDAESKIINVQLPPQSLARVNSISLKSLDKSGITDFIEYCKINEIKLLAAYPSMLYDKIYFSEAAISNLTALKDYYRKREVLFIGSFEESLYEVEDVLDTVYHLNRNGREKRTQRLLKDLGPYIEQLR